MGGLVRATGSGMGCPDWPKCFGSYVPPTCSCDLPENYQAIFLAKRMQKVEKFAAFLSGIGMKEKSELLRNSKGIAEPEAFNPAKAWTEYVNRIFGVLAGLFSLAFFVSSFQFFKSGFRLWLIAFAGFILLLFNAWLGSIVVATNLLPGIVTTHFLTAFLCLFLFMYAVHRAGAFETAGSDKPKLAWPLMFMLSMCIVLLGAYSRETADALAAQKQLIENGMLNVAGLGSSFVFHRFLPLLLLCALFLYHYRTAPETAGRVQARLGILLILLQMGIGTVNVVYILPPWSQTLHIFLGSSLPVLFFYMSIAKPKGSTP